MSATRRPRTLTRRGRAARSSRRAPARVRASRSPRDWRWQLRHAVTTVDDLAARARRSRRASSKGARRAEREGLPIAITPYYLVALRSARPGVPDPPAVRARRARRRTRSPGDLVDPLGEVAHEVAPHLVQRYPDRVLLLATDRCAVYCRFCTRSRMVGDGGGAVSLERARARVRVDRARTPRSATSS